MSVHDGLTHESTKPENMVISWLPTVLKSGDLSLDRDVIPDAMLQAGFKTVKIPPLPFPWGAMHWEKIVTERDKDADIIPI